MSAPQSYYVPVDTGEAEFTEKRSRFLGHVRRVETEAEARAFLDEMRKKYYDARHNCWCYVLHEGGVVRYGDDGEPQGTAGQPMLNVFQRENVTNVCCVVTRYFGGTLLGPGGLVRAYTAATQAAVAAAQEAGQIVEMTSVVPVDVHVAYPQYEQVLRLAQDSGAKVSDTDYTDAVTIHLVFKAGEQEPFCAKMRELMAGREEIEVGAPEFAEF